MNEQDKPQQPIPPEVLMDMAEKVLRDGGLTDPNPADVAQLFGMALGFSYLCDDDNDPSDDAALSGLLLNTVEAALDYQRRFVRAAEALG